jgi:hypothetical protein
MIEHFQASFLLLFIAVFILCQPNSFLVAQTRGDVDGFAKHQQELADRNPETLTFSVKLTDAKTQFHVGEKIRLELSFASSLPETYVFDNATYDRSGRLDIDSFVVDRTEGITDPLYDYYHKSLGGFMGGGLRGIGALTTKPQIVDYDLNEWLRFDKPGAYRLYVISHRLSKGKPYHQGNTPIEPVSNVIQFEVVPADREWEQKTLSDAMKSLDSSPKAQFGVGENPHRSACRVLRFMGTEAAVKEMIRRFRGEDRDCDFEYYVGMVGSANRTFTIQQMVMALDAPSQPVSSSFLSALIFLSYIQQYPEPSQQFADDEAGKKAARAQWETRKSNHDLIVQSYVDRLANAIALKQGAAAAISIQTLLGFQANDQGNNIELRRKVLATALAKVFLDLPLESQRNLLEYNWKQIADPEMLPVLRQLYQHPPDLHEIPQPFPGVALQRIYDLSPEEGRPLILNEIRRPVPRVSISVLGSLPDKELPQLEDAIVEHAINFKGEYRAQETVAALVARYVSPASLPRLRGFFEDKIGTLGCTVQSSLLSYFLRSDQSLGLQMIRKALASRKVTRCYASALADVVGQELTPESEALVLEGLNETDAEVVSSAVQVLCAHGSADNKDKIKAAIKRLLDQWREEKRDPDESISKEDPVQVGYFAESLLRTYARALPWLISDDELRELANLCLSDECRQQVKSWSPLSRTEITVYRPSGLKHETRFSLGLYELLSWENLKRKLIQFPKRTRFIWQLYGREGDEDRRLFDELKDYLKEHEMEVVRPSEPKNY